MLAGFIIGSAVAGSSTRSAPPRRYRGDTYAEKQRAEARRKEELEIRDADAIRRKAEADALKPVNVLIPAGCGPGSSFTVEYRGALFTLQVPPHLSGGMGMPVVFPLPSPVIATPAVSVSAVPAAIPAVASAPPLIIPPAAIGKQILISATSSNDALPRVECIADHVVDANTEREHGIITVRKGEVCHLIKGTLETGEPAPYQEYVWVRTAIGYEGRVSRFVLKHVI